MAHFEPSRYFPFRNTQRQQAFFNPLAERFRRWGRDTQSTLQWSETMSSRQCLTPLPTSQCRLVDTDLLGELRLHHPSIFTKSDEKCAHRCRFWTRIEGHEIEDLGDVFYL